VVAAADAAAAAASDVEARVKARRDAGAQLRLMSLRAVMVRMVLAKGRTPTTA